jgi:hypothetical protein
VKDGNIKKILFACLVILFNTGCKDCNKDGSCDEEYYRKTFGEMKSYFWAKKGSY